jgi:DNA-binding protein Fis
MKIEQITETSNSSFFKYCPSCNQTKPITEFSKNRTKKDGYQTSCKSCKKNLYNKSVRNVLPSKIKTGTVNRQTINDLSTNYIEKYLSEYNQKDIIQLNDLILEEKIKLVVLEHLKETKE